jgi:hypothetical protein
MPSPATQLIGCFRNRWFDGANLARIWPIPARPSQPTGRWHSWAVPENVSQIILDRADLAPIKRCVTRV